MSALKHCKKYHFIKNDFRGQKGQEVKKGHIFNPNNVKISSHIVHASGGWSFMTTLISGHRGNDKQLMAPGGFAFIYR